MTETELQRILSANPDLRVIDDGNGRPLKPPITGTSTDALASRFESLWQILGGPALVKEHKFHPERRWRFDYAHVESQVAIEINGGVWSGGRHNRGRGYLNDREKVNTATALGWRVFELGTGQVQPDAVMAIIQAIGAERTG